MKHLYKLFAFAFCGMAAVANAGNGTMTLQLDMSLGQDEPNLLDPETFAVNGEYADGILTITDMPEDMGTLKLKVNLETGEVIGEEYQIAVIDDWDPDYILTYYYYDLITEQPAVIGTIKNLGTDSCLLELQPWGAADYFQGFGIFFMALYYNTTATFNFAIPGLDLPTYVNTIGTSEEKASYYTLQGVEVRNPKPGNIYIKVTNSKSEKVLIK